jgi:hypothetical protein
VPGERNEVALQQLPDGERLTRPSRADQSLLTKAAALEPLPARCHGAQEQVAEPSRRGNHAPHVLRGKGNERRRLGREPCGERGLAREHGEIGDEGPHPALSEVPVTLRSLVDDVHGSALDDVERSLTLAVRKHFVAACERHLGADLRQVLDLRSRESREEDRIVGIEEVLDRSRRVVARHLSSQTRG